MHRHLARSVAALTSLLLAAACGGGGGSPRGRPADVSESLAALGVDTTETPRVADQATQQPLPQTYAPFGAAMTFDKIDEVALVGPGLDPAVFGGDALFTVFEEQQSPTTPGVFTTERLHAPVASSTPWAASVGTDPAALRAVAAGDFDGDGMEELLVLTRDPGSAQVRLTTVQDRLAAFATGATIDVSDAVPVSLALATGDLDGDGRADAVAAIVTATDVRLVFLESSSGVPRVSGQAITLTPISPSPALDVSLATGNLDQDPADELAVVVNEAYDPGTGQTGTSRLFVYDDASAGFAQRTARAVSATAGGAVRAAVSASVAIGDIDGDNVGEVVVGGLTSFDPAGTCQYAYLLIALDDLPAGLATVGTRYETGLFPAGATCAALRLRGVQVLTLDRDLDGADEIQVNERSYEDFREAAPWTPLGTPVPLAQLVGVSGTAYSGEFSRETTAFASGDVTGDKQPDLLFYAQHASDGRGVAVWATSLDPDPNSPTAGQQIWRRTAIVPTAAAPADPVRPILVAANVDADSKSLQYSSAERRVVFTEPIVIAALAAAPCATNLGQDTSACTTSFGTAKTTQVDVEKTFTVTAGVVIATVNPVNIPIVKVDAELEATVKGSWEHKSTDSYALTRRVVRTTGPLEDSVIFTSIPYDQFTYTIVSHPDPSQVGNKVVVSIPRSPIQTMVERSFFNDNVPEGSVQIGPDVFQHVVGSPRSYPTVAQRDALLASGPPACNLPPCPELLNGPFDVGQGGGSTTAEINVAQSLGTGNTWGADFEFKATTTVAAVKVGIVVGIGGSSGLTISHGTESYYAGTVSNIAADKYTPTSAYKFGLFSYIHHGSQQSFEVVDYWVQ